MSGTNEFTKATIRATRDRGGIQLRCPECDEINIDRGAYFGSIVGPDEGVTTFWDEDEYQSPAGTRGGYIQIDMHCAEGHSFSLFIGNHKGSEYLHVMSRADVFADAGDPEDPFEDWGSES